MSRLKELIQEYCPDGVEYKRLGEVSLKITDGMHNLPKNIFITGDYPIISAQNVNDGKMNLNSSKYVSKEIYEIENKRTNIKRGDVLLTIVGAIGRTAVVKSDVHVLAQRSLCVIHPDFKQIIPSFLKYVLDSSTLQDFMCSNAHGAAQKGIYLDQVTKLSIPVPPLPVQQEIVTILDSYTKSEQELEKRLEQELKLRKKQYAYYRNDLLSFNENVPKVQLCDVVELHRGVRVVKKQLSDDGYPVYQNSLISMGGYDKYNCAGNMPFVICAGAAGEVGYSYEPFWAADDCTYFKCPESISYRYLYHVLVNKQDYLLSRVRKASIPRLSKESIAKLIIPVPPLEEQERVVNILDFFDSYCTSLTTGLPSEISLRKKQYEYYRDNLLNFKRIDIPRER